MTYDDSKFFQPGILLQMTSWDSVFAGSSSKLKTLEQHEYVIFLATTTSLLKVLSRVGVTFICFSKAKVVKT